MDKNKLALCYEATKSTKVILDDMYTHRKDYTLGDLAWRCSDMLRAVNESLKLLLEYMLEYSEKSEEVEIDNIQQIPNTIVERDDVKDLGMDDAVDDYYEGEFESGDEERSVEDEEVE